MVHALEAGNRTIKVDAAVDIWAVGVIAFELLTGQRAFPSGAAAKSNDTVQAALAGRTPLPWEGDSTATLERLEKLRGLRRSVLKCLERDPAARPTADSLLRSWDHAFDNLLTQGPTWRAPPAP